MMATKNHRPFTKIGCESNNKKLRWYKTPLDIAIQHKQPQAIINSLYHSSSIAADIHAKQIDTSQG